MATPTAAAAAAAAAPTLAQVLEQAVARLEDAIGKVVKEIERVLSQLFAAIAKPLQSASTIDLAETVRSKASTLADEARQLIGKIGDNPVFAFLVSRVESVWQAVRNGIARIKSAIEMITIIINRWRWIVATTALAALFVLLSITLAISASFRYTCTTIHRERLYWETKATLDVRPTTESTR